MRILILTQWYPPEPALLMQELAQTLLALGHDVTVLTGYPNYPTGTLYPGYHVRLHQREMLAGVPVVRVPLYPEHSRSSVRRVLNYVSFALSSTLLGPWLVKRPDAIFAYHPPLTVGLPAYVLSRLWRVPFVYQIQDMWPESLSASGMLNNPRILAWVGSFADLVYRWAAAICVISPGFRQNLLSKGVPAEKIHVISNWVDTGTYYPAEPDEVLAARLELAGYFNVMYAGNIGQGQGLETLLEAAHILRDIPEIQFVIVGDGVALPTLQQVTQTKGLTNVRFLGSYPTADMPALYALAEVLLVHLRDDPLYRITIPHKVFSYMASGKPILVAVAGDAATLVTNARAGLSCVPDNPEMLAQKVKQFFDMPQSERCMMAISGLKAVEQQYNKDVAIKKIEMVLKSTVCP